MNSKILICLLFAVLLFFAVPSVFATDTEITVTAPANHSVTVNVLNPSSGDAYDSLENMTNEAGVVKLIYVAGGQREISFYVIVRKDGHIVDSRSFDDNYQSGSPISLDMSTPAVPVVPVVPAVVPINTTAENSSVTENVSDNTSAAVVVENNPAPGAVTGLTASGLSGFSFSIIYYIVGGLIGAVAIFFAGRFGYNQFSNWRAYQGYGSVASTPSSGKSPIVVSKELLEAEKKIKQATAELEKIKGKQGRLQEAERKFEESKRELEKIRRERY